MNKSGKQIALVLLIFALFLAVIMLNKNSLLVSKTESLQYSEFLTRLDEGVIKKVSIESNRTITGTYIKDNVSKDFKTIIPYEDPALLTKLTTKNVEVSGKIDEPGLFYNIFIQGGLLWIVILIVFWIIMARQLSGGGNKAMSFGKSRAKLHPETKNKITFLDVAGVDEAKQELTEIIDFLKDPKKFSAIGAKIPKGVLLMGPPGTGKTLLARAIAGEAKVPFFSISGSDFVEMFVGVGASRVRDLFEQGKKSAPCIIFIDEIDAVGRLRGAGLGGGHDEREQTLNQLLVEMDGFETNEGVIIVAATNRPDVLDPALLRPGRFDRQVVVDAPDIKGREKILAVHSRKIPLAREVDLKVIARGTPGFTGADLANLINEAALLAARENRKRVTMKELEAAKDKVLMGPERRSLLISDDEKQIIAYHEAGHAILGLMLPTNDVVHKVTIIPRGRALGLTMNLPKEDKHLHSRDYWINQITILFGGYVAEKTMFGDITTGSSNDLERATDIARRMVCEWGMSSNFGPMTFGKAQEQIFLGREISQHRDFSEATAEKIDVEVRSIIGSCEKRAQELVNEHKVIFERLATSLIERETIDTNDIALIVKGEPLPPLDRSNDSDKLAEEAEDLAIKNEAEAAAKLAAESTENKEESNQ